VSLSVLFCSLSVLSLFSLCSLSVLSGDQVATPARTVTLAMLGVVGAVVLSVANGGNDIANSMGVVTGASALSMRQALVLGGVFEFLGAITMVSVTVYHCLPLFATVYHRVTSDFVPLMVD
jgi:hypothetical protein